MGHKSDGRIFVCVFVCAYDPYSIIRSPHSVPTLAKCFSGSCCLRRRVSFVALFSKNKHSRVRECGGGKLYEIDFTYNTMSVKRDDLREGLH